MNVIKKYFLQISFIFIWLALVFVLSYNSVLETQFSMKFRAAVVSKNKKNTYNT